MNNKLGFSAGILNIVLGVVTFVDAVLIAIMAFCCLLMSFSLFFMAAIPAFLATGFLCCMALAAAVANAVTGSGAVITAIKGGNISKIFSTVSIIVDVAIIPANVIALVCGAYLLYTEVSGLSILIFIIAALSIILACVSLGLNLNCIMRNKKAKTVEPNATDI